MFDFEALLIGAGVGFCCAVVGAILDYRLAARNRKANEAENGRLPGCIYIVSGSLGVIGIIVIFLSFLVHSLGRALVAGLGVSAGFFLGFLLMSLVWMLTQNDA